MLSLYDPRRPRPPITAPAPAWEDGPAAPRADQRATASIVRGGTHKFFARVQNDRDVTDTITVRGVAAGAPGYRVTYLQGRTDITAQVEAGTHTTPTAAIG